MAGGLWRRHAGWWRTAGRVWLTASDRAGVAWADEALRALGPNGILPSRLG